MLKSNKIYVMLCYVMLCYVYFSLHTVMPSAKPVKVISSRINKHPN